MEHSYYFLKGIKLTFPIPLITFYDEPIHPKLEEYYNGAYDVALFEKECFEDRLKIFEEAKKHIENKHVDFVVMDTSYISTLPFIKVAQMTNPSEELDNLFAVIKAKINHKDAPTRIFFLKNSVSVIRRRIELRSRKGEERIKDSLLYKLDANFETLESLLRVFQIDARTFDGNLESILYDFIIMYRMRLLKDN